MISKNYFLVLSAVLCLLGCVKHDNRPQQQSSLSTDENSTQSAAVRGAVGKRVYQTNCASCHSDFEHSSLKDRSIQEIRAALNAVGAMQSLGSKMTEAELNELAFALRSDTDMTPPSQPQNPKATVLGPTSIGLSWGNSTDNAGGSGIASYRIQRNGREVQLLGSELNEFVDDELSPGTHYQYQIVAIDKSGNESLDNPQIEATTTVLSGQDSTAPQTPENLVAHTTSATRVSLSWNATSDEAGGSGLKSYGLFRNDALIAHVSAISISYTDSNLAAGSNYQYQIQATDNAGNVSPKSAKVLISTPNVNGTQLYAARCVSCHQEISVSEVRNSSAEKITTAISQQTLMAPLKDLGADEIAAIANALSDSSDKVKPTMPGAFAGQAVSPQLITLTWTASTDAGGSGLKAYQLYRNGTVINGLIKKDALGFSDTGLTPSTNYEYQLFALDNAGNISAGTAKLKISTPKIPDKPDTIKPTQPGNLTAIPISYDTIRVSWDASTDAGGSGMASYKVFRDGALIQTVTVPTVAFTNSGLTPLTTYKYRVVAVDGAKNESAPTADKSVSTLAPDGVALYVSRNCRNCHGSLADSNLRFRTTNVEDFVTLFKNAVRPVAQGGIAEMQNKGINNVELRAIASLLAGEDNSGGNPDFTATYEYKQPAGTRSFVASFLINTFVNLSAPTAEDTNIKKLISDSVGTNATTFGGSCSRYDADCPQLGGNHADYANASPSPNFDVARAGYILNLCAQILETDTEVAATLMRTGLQVNSAANLANITKSYSLFFPARSPSQATQNALVAVHAQAKNKGLSDSKAWQMVLLPLCESSVGGGI